MKKKIMRKKMIYWIATILVTIAFIIPGIGNLLHAPHFMEDMIHLGYPTYFLTIFGIWKILGAIAIAIPRSPRLKEWAYAGMFFDLTGAASSRVATGDGLAMTIVPLLILAIVLLSWWLRPIERKLVQGSTKNQSK